MAYRGQRRFPAALGAQAADPRILVRLPRRIEAGCAHRFERTRWRVSSLWHHYSGACCEIRANPRTRAGFLVGRVPFRLNSRLSF